MIFNRLKKSTKEEEQRFAEMMEEEKVGCADKFAMLVSAFFVIMIPCALVLCLFAGLIMWMIGALG